MKDCLEIVLPSDHDSKTVTSELPTHYASPYRLTEAPLTEEVKAISGNQLVDGLVHME